MSVIHLVDVIREHSSVRRAPRPVVDSTQPILALPPGRSERPLRAPGATGNEADAHSVSTARTSRSAAEHTLASGHPIFSQWLRCRAARAGY